MNILENENIFIKYIKEAKKNGKKVYIYGTGSGASILAKGLERKDYFSLIDGFVVDKEYKNDDFFLNKSIFANDEYDRIKGSLIINSIRELSAEKKEFYSQLSDYFLDEDIMSFWSIDGDIFDEEFVVNNKKKFLQTYNLFDDDYSKNVMDSWINSKISGKKVYLNTIWDEKQYYLKSIINFNNIKMFVDCGAFDGDSFISFVQEYKNNIGYNYSGSAYLFEPDSYSYSIMNNNLKNYKNVICCNMGISDSRKNLLFETGNTTSSGFTAKGTTLVKVDSLDNLIKEKIDFVKMDIEGSEIDALNGMKNHIINEKPQLAICVYHKRDDLLTIPQYIYGINSSYKFYLRAHKPWSQELVLYAI